eukprot:TRINITY_DN19092_c0_g1_i1.p1 TRINITY_DN19092_c0_g1~~TRINITY_DN19092_c0_g1_i1.p1  ORF type:complete len:225 (+),score=52.51 TRINITY_DN19092_c0_g1_i1:303-977(+)
MGETASSRTVTATKLFIRLASVEDVPQILLLIKHLAEFEKLEHEVVATEDALRETIFSGQPFKGPTVLMLEVAEGPADVAPQAAGKAALEEHSEEISSPAEVEDPQRTAHVSAYDKARIVVGFALFFPNYSTFLARPGFYLEDLCIRSPYRRCGFGTKLLTRLAQISVAKGAGRLEWSVLDWNQKAIDFYKNRMGANIMEEWRICRLTGSSLEAATSIPGSCKQ